MFIIFGTRGVKHTVSENPILTNSCPNCSGSLVNKLYRRWLTLFFIPVIPLDTIDRFYECNKCGNAYNESIKNILQQNQVDKEQALQDAKKLFTTTVIAAMTHMAIIDDDFAAEEEREILDMISNFPDMTAELTEVMEKVKKDGNKDNYVFDLLLKARLELSSEALINILGQAGIVLLADGQIEKEEEDLMKDYLVACGLPKDLYKKILEKLEKKEIAEV